MSLTIRTGKLLCSGSELKFVLWWLWAYHFKLRLFETFNILGISGKGFLMLISWFSIYFISIEINHFCSNARINLHGKRCRCAIKCLDLLVKAKLNNWSYKLNMYVSASIWFAWSTRLFIQIVEILSFQFFIENLMESRVVGCINNLTLETVSYELSFNLIELKTKLRTNAK